MGLGRCQTKDSRVLLVVEFSVGEVIVGGLNSVGMTEAVTVAEPVAMRVPAKTGLLERNSKVRKNRSLAETFVTNLV